MLLVNWRGKQNRVVFKRTHQEYTIHSSQHAQGHYSYKTLQLTRCGFCERLHGTDARGVKE